MDVLRDLLHEKVILRDLLATGLLLLVVLLLRRMALRLVRRGAWASEAVLLRLTSQIRWASLLVILLGLLAIWFAELRTLALSAVAIAAAVAIATKELVMCISGSLLRATSRAFSIGDRIEIGGIRGDVISFDALTTTVLEIGPTHRRTGRAVTFPNSQLFISAVVNESVTENYVLHTITVPVKREGLEQAQEHLLAIGEDVCAPFVNEARKHINERARRHGLPALSVEPTASLQVPKVDEFNLLLRVPTGAREKGQTEQAILRRFFGLESGEHGAEAKHPSP